MRRPNATIGQAGTLSAAKIRMNSIDNARPSETAKCYELSADTCHHSATMAEGPSPDTSIIDKSSQKILANRVGCELCSVSGREFNSEQCAASVSLPDKKKLARDAHCSVRLPYNSILFPQDRGHKRKSRRPRCIVFRETRVQSKHRAPALPVPVG